MARLRTALIGVGAWGKVLARAASQSRKIEFAACVGRNPERLAAFSRETGIPAGKVDVVLADKTIDGLEANVDRATAYAGMSPSIVTPLNKLIGYEAAAKIAKHSVAKGITVRCLVDADGGLPSSDDGDLVAVVARAY